MKAQRDFLMAALALTVGWACFPPGASAGSAPAPMAVTSRNAPAFASSASVPGAASNANDDFYEAFDYHSWISSSVPAWIAYDLSAIPPGHRRWVDILWSNSVNAYEYDIATNVAPLGLPCDYTIEVNSSRGSMPPADGWVTLVSVTNNVFQSRQHVVDLNHCNWVR
jgi:hypothetical protein